MLDLGSISETFERLSGCYEIGKDSTHGGMRTALGEYYDSFEDPHPDADAWLLASPSARAKMNEQLTAKLRQLIEYRSKAEKERLEARKKAQYRWRERNREQHLEGIRRWCRENQEHRNAYDRARRARLAALKPPKVRKTAEDNKTYAREWWRKNAERLNAARRAKA